MGGIGVLEGDTYSSTLSLIRRPLMGGDSSFVGCEDRATARSHPQYSEPEEQSTSLHLRYTDTKNEDPLIFDLRPQRTNNIAFSILEAKIGSKVAIDPVVGSARGRPSFLIPRAENNSPGRRLGSTSALEPL